MSYLKRKFRLQGSLIESPHARTGACGRARAGRQQPPIPGGRFKAASTQKTGQKEQPTALLQLFFQPGNDDLPCFRPGCTISNH
jgi:hypothetical protein